jgi:hypothetical protein
MDKVEKILQRYKIYLGVRDVAVEIRPYKTRDAFTNLASSPPTIYLNEYLIDDEEVLDYLILRELIHIALHKYPPMRYTGGLSYAEKFDSALNFFLPKEKVEEIREKMVKKLIEVKTRSMTSFSSFVCIPAPPPAPRHPSGGMSWAKKRKKRLIHLQVFLHRTFLTGIIIPVSLSL